MHELETVLGAAEFPKIKKGVGGVFAWVKQQGSISKVGEHSSLLDSIVVSAERAITEVKL